MKLQEPTSKALLVINRAPPPSGNRLQRMHWARVVELKRLWHMETAVAAANAKRPRFNRARVQLVLYYRQRRKRDSDNLMAGAAKLILDGLRAAGVIPDDDQQTIQLPEPIVRIDRKQPRVEIQIEALPQEGWTVWSKAWSLPERVDETGMLMQFCLAEIRDCLIRLDGATKVMRQLDGDLIQAFVKGQTHRDIELSKLTFRRIKERAAGTKDQDPETLDCYEAHRSAAVVCKLAAEALEALGAGSFCD